MGRRRQRKPKWTPEQARVGDLDRRGRAIVAAGEGGRPRPAHVDGALPGEIVELLRTEREGPIDGAQIRSVLEPAADRVPPRCPHYGVCGGCSLMHMAPEAQLAFKQGLLLADFAAHGVTPERVLEPLRGPIWAYRRRARLDGGRVARSRGGAPQGRWASPVIGTKRTRPSSRRLKPLLVRVITRSDWTMVPTGATRRPPTAS